MQIYNSPISPFGARVVIAARIKDIPIERLALPPNWRQSPEIRALNPVRKIPILLTDEGMVLPESETILRYLDDRFPDPSLTPIDPDQRARMNLLMRITDLYVMAPVIRLFPHIDVATRDARVVASEVGYWQDGLASLAYFLDSPPERLPVGATLLDCVLPPSLHLCRLIAGAFGLGDILAPHPAITAYYEEMLRHPVVGAVLSELTEAQARR